MKNKKFLALALLPVLALSACAQDDGYKVKVVTPAGAPAVAFYNAKAGDGYLDVKALPTDVPGEFVKGEADMVVFDFYNGLHLNKTKEKDYKLARILTGGNLYLVGINKTGEPTKNDNIVMFGKQGLLPDLVFKDLYADAIGENNVSYVPGVASLPPILTTGKLGTVTQDYAVVAQPILNIVLDKIKEKNSPTELNVIASFRTKWAEKTGQNMIPQAGLFVNSKTYEEHKVAFDNELKRIDERVNNTINNVDEVVRVMNENAAVEKQKAFFNFDSQDVAAVQNSKLTPNGFAMVDPREGRNCDKIVKEFLQAIGKGAEDYSSYIL